MVLKKEEVSRPTLPAETHAVPEIGGDIIVQGLRLRDRVEIGSQASDADRVSRILALTVVDADRKPIYTTDEWETFGGMQPLAAFKLLDIAMRLSGMTQEPSEKKDSPQS